MASSNSPRRFLERASLAIVVDQRIGTARFFRPVGNQEEPTWHQVQLTSFRVRLIDDCESTGVYHRRLLQLAGSLGMRTALVHGEAVAKFRAIQFADHGKTDARDPRAALTAAKVGKLVKDRKLDKHYAQMVASTPLNDIRPTTGNVDSPSVESAIAMNEAES